MQRSECVLIPQARSRGGDLHKWIMFKGIHFMVGTLGMKNISIFGGPAQYCHIILGCRPMRCVTDEMILERRLEVEEVGTEKGGDAVLDLK